MAIPSPCLPTVSLTTALFAGKTPCFNDLSNILRETKFDIRAHECIQLWRKLLLVRGDTMLTKYSIFASASRSKVETLRQLLHRIPEQLLSVGDIGGPVLGGEVVGVVGDEL